MTEFVNIGRETMRRTQSSIVFVNRKRRPVRVVAGIRKVLQRRRGDGVVKPFGLEFIERRLQLRHHSGGRPWKRNPTGGAIRDSSGAVAALKNKSDALPVQEPATTEIVNIGWASMRRSKSSVIFVNHKGRPVRVVAGVRKVFQRRRGDGVIEPFSLGFAKRRLQLRHHSGGRLWKHYPIVAPILGRVGAIAGRNDESDTLPMKEATMTELVNIGPHAISPTPRSVRFPNHKC